MRTKMLGGTVALVCTLAACGGGSSKQVGLRVDASERTPVELVSGAADATAQAKTARLDIDVSVDTGSGDTADVTMGGRVALDGSRADISMNLAAFVPGASDDAKIRVLVIDGVSYMQFGALWNAMSAMAQRPIPSALRNVQWVKTETGTQSSSSPSNFTQYLEYLRGATKGAIVDLGTDQIDGVRTRHFEAQIDPAAAVRKLDEQLQGSSGFARQGLAQAKQLLRGMHTIPSTAWIDAAGRPRRVEMHFDTTVQGQHLVMQVRMGLSDFGVRVDDIVAPPADEVTDMTKLQAAVA